MDYKFIIVASIFIGFDIVSGVLSALITGTFKSSTMRVGGMHKLFLLVVIAFGYALDYAQILVDMGFSIPCLSSICLYITFMEICSIFENIEKGFPGALPRKLVNTLNQVAKENGVNDGEQED